MNVNFPDLSDILKQVNDILTGNDLFNQNYS